MIAKYAEHLKKCINKYQFTHPDICMGYCMAVMALAKKIGFKEFEELQDICNSAYIHLPDHRQDHSMPVFSTSEMVKDMLNHIILENPSTQLNPLLFQQAINTQGYVDMDLMRMIPESLIKRAYALAAACTSDQGIAIVPDSHASEAYLLHTTYIVHSHAAIASRSYVEDMKFYAALPRDWATHKLGQSNYNFISELVLPFNLMIKAESTRPDIWGDKVIVCLEYSGPALQIIWSRGKDENSYLLYPLNVKSASIQLM